MEEKFMNNEVNCSGTKIRQARGGAGFTLIEMLAVIAIIGLLAGLILGGQKLATASSHRNRAQAERDALINAIEKYKKVKGYYPPDNSNTNAPFYEYQNTLFYELTGCTPLPGSTRFTANVTGLTLKQSDIQNMFGDGTVNGLSGILNSSADSNAPADNFYPGLKANQYCTVRGTNNNSVGSYVADYTVLGTAVQGPILLQQSAVGLPGAARIYPFHYVVSNPQHNQGRYDLWVDIIYSGKTNRISNWSDVPETL